MMGLRLFITAILVLIISFNSFAQDEEKLIELQDKLNSELCAKWRKPKECKELLMSIYVIDRERAEVIAQQEKMRKFSEVILKMEEEIGRLEIEIERLQKETEAKRKEIKRNKIITDWLRGVMFGI